MNPLWLIGVGVWFLVFTVYAGFDRVIRNQERPSSTETNDG